VNQGYLRAVYLRLAGAIMFAVTAGLLCNAWLSHRTFENALAPEVAKEVATVGASMRTLVLRAVDSGIDFHELYGVDQKFEEVKEEVPQIAAYAITDAGGRPLYGGLVLPAQAAMPAAGPARTQRVGQQLLVSLPIAAGDRPLGTLHLGVDVRFVDDVVLEMLYDVLVVLVVSLFFTLELLHFIAGARLEAALQALADAFGRGASGRFATPARRVAAGAFGALLPLLEQTLERVNRAFAALAREVDEARRGPAHERPPGLADAQGGLQALAQRFRFGAEGAADAPPEDRLAKLRAPLFVFILAEELTRPFLPGYVKDLLVPIPGLSPQFVLGLPIALFMFIVAVAQPGLGVWCERLGQRRTMFVGALVAAVGYLASALAGSVLDLMAWRSLCAAGYAMVFVAGQAYVLEHAPAGQRAKSFSTFVGAIMVATVCGPSIGGILADNIGERATLGVAAALALASLATIRGLPACGPRGGGAARVRVPRLAEVGTLLANRRFMTVTALAAVPAKLLLTGICFYLVPLYVLSIGGTQAMAGRVLMGYAVVMVMLAPTAAAWAGTRERMGALVGGGLVVSGLGGMLLLAGGHVGWVVLAVALAGVGQAMSIAAQSALVAELCRDEIARLGEGTVYGVYRLLERLGNALGPLVAAALVVGFGYRAGFVAIGVFVLACGLAFLLVTRRVAAVVVATA